MKRKVLVAAALSVVLAGLSALWLMKWCSGPAGTGVERVVTVERGWGVRRIAEVLEDSGLVRCRYYFLWRYSRLDGPPTLQAGTYLLTGEMTPDSILDILTEGLVVPVATSWVTLVPGETLDRSLEDIARQTPLSPEDLDSLARDSSFLASMGIPCLEGYLFPETYEFADTLDAEEVLRRIVRTGKERWPEDMCHPRTGLTTHETVILASIVEKEVMVDSERPVVAGIFLERLRRGMKLESCATVQYALGEPKARLLYSDLEVRHPYNTYLHPGLPPGPICSPGYPSLLAALYPDTTTGYLYFVSRKDGSGGHLFASTLAGHSANVRSVRER